MITEPFVLKEMTLGALLDSIIDRQPDQLAVVYANKGLRQTWAEFGQSVDATAKGLMRMGVEKGDKVALWATNEPHWLTLMYATAKIGAILVPVNTSYRNEELQYLFEKSDSSVIFAGKGFRDHNFLTTLEGLVPEIYTSPKGAITSGKLPMLRAVVSLGDTDKPGFFTLASVMEMGKDISTAEYEARKADILPEDAVNMQYTSGTTGFPKGVMLSHINILNNGYWIGRHQNFSSNDRVCLPVPLFHCFGCVLGVMACVNHGATMVLMDTFDASNTLASVDKEKCTALYGVPTMYLAMLEHKNFPKTDTSSLRTGIMAGSVCPAPLMTRVIEQMHMKEITICYGLTEGSPVMTQTHADEEFNRRVSTVGRAMPGIEVRIVDPVTMKEMPRNQPGEVVCRGYNVMKGYYNNPEATADIITDGWLHSGDLGTMDDDGYVVITGRKKDMILRGGENIYPREVEEFLSGMPEVLDIQIVGTPSRVYGEEVVAFIIPREGCTVTSQKIRSFCKGRIAWQKVPRYIELVDKFPLTASGKIQKFVLREWAIKKYVRLA